MDHSNAVLAVNERFYRAFEALDLDLMTEVWARTDSDVCIHPGWEILRGWDEIREAWRVIFANTGFMRFESSDVELVLNGDVAHICCVENIFSVIGDMTIHSRVACTNIFELTDDGWRMVLHHGSPIASSQVMQPSGDSSCVRADTDGRLTGQWQHLLEQVSAGGGHSNLDLASAMRDCRPLRLEEALVEHHYEMKRMIVEQKHYRVRGVACVRAWWWGIGE